MDWWNNMHPLDRGALKGALLGVFITSPMWIAAIVVWL